MSDIIHPFQIPIYQSFIDNNSFIQIKKDVLAYINSNKEEFKLDWDCPTLSNITSNTNFQSKTLYKTIQTHTENYFKSWGIRNKTLLNISDLWINISPKNSYQEVHNHLSTENKNLFSGVLHIDVFPNSGNLILLNPLISHLHHMLPSSKIDLKTSIPLKNKNIFMFPAWLDHYVGTNKNEQNRISISWNVEAKSI